MSISTPSGTKSKTSKPAKKATTANTAPGSAAATKGPAASSGAPKPSTAPVTQMGAKTPPASAPATPTVVDAPQSVILGPVLRKKELIDSVVERSGIKKKDAKPVVEAMLDVLGEALGENRELILPPFGRIKIRKERMMPNGRILITKIRQAAPGAGGSAKADKAAKDSDTD